jgi:4-aminobutyrate aminotransferase-like enzyme
MSLVEDIKKHAVYVQAYQTEMVPLSAVISLLNNVDLTKQADELLDKLADQLKDVQQTLNEITND